MRLLEPAGAAVAPAPGPAAAGSATVVDVRSGDRLTLLDAAAMATVGDGAAVLTRALPVDEVWLHTGAVVPIPAVSRQRALDLVGEEVRPFPLLHLLVDLQVDALRG
jgi:hypothetical protein